MAHAFLGYGNHYSVPHLRGAGGSAGRAGKRAIPAALARRGGVGKRAISPRWRVRRRLASGRFPLRAGPTGGRIQPREGGRCAAGLRFRLPGARTLHSSFCRLRRPERKPHDSNQQGERDELTCSLRRRSWRCLSSIRAISLVVAPHLLRVGRNYEAHAREMGHDPDREPPFFLRQSPPPMLHSRALAPPASFRIRRRRRTCISRWNSSPRSASKGAISPAERARSITSTVTRSVST